MLYLSVIRVTGRSCFNLLSTFKKASSLSSTYLTPTFRLNQNLSVILRIKIRVLWFIHFHWVNLKKTFRYLRLSDYSEHTVSSLSITYIFVPKVNECTFFRSYKRSKRYPIFNHLGQKAYKLLGERFFHLNNCTTLTILTNFEHNSFFKDLQTKTKSLFSLVSAKSRAWIITGCPQSIHICSRCAFNLLPRSPLRSITSTRRTVHDQSSKD